MTLFQCERTGWVNVSGFSSSLSMWDHCNLVIRIQTMGRFDFVGWWNTSSDSIRIISFRAKYGCSECVVFSRYRFLLISRFSQGNYRQRFGMDPFIYFLNIFSAYREGRIEANRYVHPVRDKSKCTHFMRSDVCVTCVAFPFSEFTTFNRLISHLMFVMAYRVDQRIPREGTRLHYLRKVTRNVICIR